MAYIQTVPINAATGITQKHYEAALSRTGYVSKIIQVMTRDERSMNASMQFYLSLMKSRNALAADTRELLATVVSNVNGCYY